MKRMSLFAAVAGLAVGQSSYAAEIYKSEDATVDVGGRLQTMAFTQRVQDPTRADGRLYLFAKQARLMFGATYADLRFSVGLAFAGEEEIKAPSPGVSLSLLDFQMDAPVPLLGQRSFVRIGQFKVPYSRERLTDSGDLPFADRSIQNLGFRMGRDVGGALHFGTGPVLGAVGIFTGGGRDIPERYLPQILGAPMVVARVGFNHNLDRDAFSGALAGPATPWKGAPRPTTLVGAAYVNALYLKDSLVGHSTVLNIRPSERPLLLNASWNPYLGQAPFAQGDLFMVGADAAMMMPFAGGTLSGEVEGNYGRYASMYGAVRAIGARAQLAMAWQKWQATARYAVLFPDEKFATGGVAITGRAAMHEVTPSLSYSLLGGRMKMLVDLPVLLNVPVAVENGIGAYVLTEQPDSASVVKAVGNTVARQNVIEARAMVQATF